MLLLFLLNIFISWKSFLIREIVFSPRPLWFIQNKIHTRKCSLCLSHLHIFQYWWMKKMNFQGQNLVVQDCVEICVAVHIYNFKIEYTEICLQWCSYGKSYIYIYICQLLPLSQQSMKTFRPCTLRKFHQTFLNASNQMTYIINEKGKYYLCYMLKQNSLRACLWGDISSGTCVHVTFLKM